MKNIMISIIGESSDNAMIGLRDFLTERVILIYPKKHSKVANRANVDISKLKIDSDLVEMNGNMWEETFRIISEIKSKHDKQNIIVNVGAGDSITKCAATCAAYVNGLKAFDVMDNKTMLLPIMKFSYYKLITDKKLDIIKYIDTDKTCCASLEELSKKLKMSLPLLAYHVNGSTKTEGLKELGLVETHDHGKMVSIGLSELGRMLVKGYVKPEVVK